MLACFVLSSATASVRAAHASAPVASYQSPSPRTEPVMTPAAVEALQREGHATLWVYFTDKGETDRASFARAVSSAGATVTEASRMRRARQLGGRFVPDYSDVPALPRYVHALEVAGAQVRHVSRWLNAVSVVADEATANRIAALPYVRRIAPVMSAESALAKPTDYGSSLTQNTGINAIAAHDSGYSGAGVIIGVLDTGFRKSHIVVSPLKRIAEWDFVHSDSETANEAGEDDENQWIHGTGVWSIVGGYLPSGLIGPSYNASFVLAKVHDFNTPLADDEDHWVAAAQWVDSIGVDIVQSSIVVQYPIDQLDGETTPVAQATNTLSRHGILVVTAMGNSGPTNGTLWSPSDCDSILAVGSVNESNVISSFSSRGPTFDGRGKPDLVAQGENTVWALAIDDNFLGSYPGTSLAAPLVTGAAGLVQEAHPEWSAQKVRYALKSTADKAATRDSTTYGWGRPNVVKAIYQSTLGGPVFPKPFILASPANGSSISAPPVTFRWRRTVDPNGDAITYTFTLKRVSTGLVIYSTSTTDTTATYSGGLSVGAIYEWNVVAADPALHGRSAQEPFRFTKTGGVDHPPTVSVAPTVNGSEGVHFTFPVNAGDPDGDPISSLTGSPLPSGATFSSSGSHTTGTFDWTPDYTQAGVYNVTFTATNALSGNSPTQITIANSDQAPQVTAPGTVSAAAGSTISFSISASDPDGQAIASLTLDASGLPGGNDATLTPGGGNTTGNFLWHSMLADTGTFDVQFQASNALDGFAGTSIELAAVVVKPSIVAPADTMAVEGSPLTLTATSTSSDGSQILTITASGMPASLSFTHTPSVSPSTATLSGTPTAQDTVTDPFTITWIVTTAAGGRDTTTTILHVNSVSATQDPSATGPPRIASFRNHPNPFYAKTQIEIRMAGRPAGGRMTLQIFDVRGRLIRTLLDGNPVSAVVPWDGTTDLGERAASGVYYYRLEVANLREIRRLVLLK